MSAISEDEPAVYKSPLVRLFVYYAAVLGSMLGAYASFPWLAEGLDRERARHVMMGRGMEEVAPQIEATFSQFAITPIVAASVLLAMLLALPVAWVYGRTSRKKVYSQGFAQSLVVLPVAICTVVFLVKGSLALAFSLAGIVAAVRFRSRLTEIREATFLFVVIGIGLAAGVQLLLVAFAASLIFNVAWLAIVGSDFGKNPQRLEGWTLRPRPKPVKPPEEVPEEQGLQRGR